jgi:putative aldouronate transport system substrate-binding protein
LQQIISDATYRYILGLLDVAGFQNAVEEWKLQGGEQIMNEYTEHYQATLTNP